VAREINVLSSFHHPNIIRLVGFCLPLELPSALSPPPPPQAAAAAAAAASAATGSSMCLVYEYASRGGLHKVLQDDAKAEQLVALACGWRWEWPRA
jgi:serine/threonine protein kinase